MIRIGLCVHMSCLSERNVGYVSIDIFGGTFQGPHLPDLSFD